jgi:hypothetical protein
MRAATVTVNRQLVLCATLSRALHCTVVGPTANSDPDGRVQETSIGATPPVVVGAAKVTTAPVSLVALALTLAGHAIVSGGFGGGFCVGGVCGGGLGLVGDEQPARNTTNANAPSVHALLKREGGYRRNNCRTPTAYCIGNS